MSFVEQAIKAARGAVAGMPLSYRAPFMVSSWLKYLDHIEASYRREKEIAKGGQVTWKTARKSF